VLINGAGGSAGSFAVQMALRAGANVTVIDHQNKLDFLSSLGAHHVFDYQKLPKTYPAKYDKILDLVGHQSVTYFGRLLSVEGTYVIVGGRTQDLFSVLIKGGLLSAFGPKKFSLLAHAQNQSDMLAVAEMMEKRDIKATIDHEYPLDDIQQAFQRVLSQRSTGKVVVRLSNEQL
jgi:NADPH:quinone reductase-like Zn-dependent oxidoreductase